MAEAAGLAAAFAADYLSWDEADAARRGRVLAGYLRDPGADPGRLGWDGTGRQRAELALPGRVVVDGEGRLLVDVRVRVTPYRLVGDAGGRAGPGAGRARPAVAPAPTGRGWRSCASLWVRLTVPIVRDGPRLASTAGTTTGRAGDRSRRAGWVTAMPTPSRPASLGAALVALLLTTAAPTAAHAGLPRRGRGAARQAGRRPARHGSGSWPADQDPDTVSLLTRRSHHEATCMRLA